MIINIKQKKGITLISMILTVIVLLIIVGTISYSSRSSFETKKLEDLYSDIDALYDAISIYYVKNKTLPVYYSNKTITGESVEYQPIAFSEAEDSKYTYYIIDVTKLNNIVLNNKNNVPTIEEKDETTGAVKTISLFDSGSYSENLTTTYESDGTEVTISDFDIALNAGMFVVNSSTHAVYYTKGITVDDVTYYTKNEQFSKIPTFSKIDKRSIEDDILDKDENAQGYNDEDVTIIFYANGGTNAPDNIMASREHVNTPEDSLEEKLNVGSVGIPNKNGMKFKGWATSADTDPLYEYNESESRIYKCRGDDIRFSQTTSNVIELYAVWQVDENLILYCYYPESTGGILPSTLDNKSFERTGKGDSVKNYLAIDIPSSGYTVSWDWDTNSNDLQEARFVGNSQTNQITSGSTIYQSTEPGTIQIKGSFYNLNVTLDMYNNTNNEESTSTQSEPVTLKLKESEEIKILKLYQINAVQKDMVNGQINEKYQWLTGIDGKMQIPSNPTTFIPFGIQTPAGEADYDTNEKTKYYLKNVILFDEEKMVESVVSDGQTHELNSVVQITDENNCLYPCFGARNYAITSSDGGVKYYHESLQEAYNQAYDLKYDKITVLRNVNSCSFEFLKWYDLDDRKIIDWNNIKTKNEEYENVSSNYYVAEHDPTYAINCTLNSGNSNHKITLDCSDYIIGRKANINLKNYASLIVKADSSNSGIIFFDNSSEQAIQLDNASKLYIQEGISVFSDNGAVIGLQSSSSLFLHKGKVINLNTENPKAISSTSISSKIYLGIKNSDSELNVTNNLVPDGETIVSTETGLPIFTLGKFYWKSGLLKTSDLANKSGYNDLGDGGLEKLIYTRSQDLKSCLYYDFSENKVCAKLGIRDWCFYDKDNGDLRGYYSENLVDAHDCINLKEIESQFIDTSMNRIDWLHPRMASGDENSVTITKKQIIINFNSQDLATTAFNDSLLNINTKTGISNDFDEYIRILNLKCETTRGINIENSTVGFFNCHIGLSSSAENINALKATNSFVNFGAEDVIIYTNGSGSAIYNKDSKIYFASDNQISNNVKIFTNTRSEAIYNTGSEAEIIITRGNFEIYSTENSNADYIITNIDNAVFNCFDVDLNNVIEIKNSKYTGKAIYNEGICKLNVNIKSAATSGYAIVNKGSLEITGGTIQSKYGLYNNDVATAEMYISYNTNIIAKERGINSKKGKVYIFTNKVDNKDIVYPTIETTASAGKTIYSSGGAEIYIGGDNDEIIANSNYPLIKSQNIGIELATKNDKLYFYDGKIMAKNNVFGSYAKDNCVPLDGYSVCYSQDEDGYNIAQLGPSAPKIVSKLGSTTGTAYTSGTWANKKIYTTLNVSKIGSGIKEYQWKYRDSGVWRTEYLTTTNNVGKITFSTERNGTVYFRAVDNNGIISEESSIVIKMDRVNPEVTFSPNGQKVTYTSGGTSDFATTVTVNGGTSGNKSLQYVWSTDSSSEPNGNWTTFTSGTKISKSIPSAAKMYLWIKAADNAGNTTVIVSNAFDSLTE